MAQIISVLSTIFSLVSQTCTGRLVKAHWMAKISWVNKISFQDVFPMILSHMLRANMSHSMYFHLKVQNLCCYYINLRGWVYFEFEEHTLSSYLAEYTCNNRDGLVCKKQNILVSGNHTTSTSHFLSAHTECINDL